MGNISALVVLILTFWVPTLSHTVKNDRTLLLATWMTLSVRHGLALVNAFVAPISTTWGDLYKFHNIGAGIYHDAGQPYGEFLGIVYRALGTSFWLGEEASILTYSISLILFVEIGVLLGLRHKLVGCVLLFGCMPSPAIHCSVTLRESYQVFGFLGAAYALLRIRVRYANWAWLLLTLSLCSMVIMHQGLALFAVVVLAVGVPWALQGRGVGSGVIAMLLITFGPLFVPTMLERLQRDSSSVQAITEGRFLQYAATYRNNVESARSDYGVKIDPEGFVSFASTTLAVIVMYFLAPLPWQATSTMDFYAFFEVIVRLALIYGCVQQIAASEGERRHRLLFLLAMALSLEIMWALGTINWGTALRHHVVVFGAFVLLGLPHFTFTLDPELAGLLHRRERRKQSEALV